MRNNRFLLSIAVVLAFVALIATAPAEPHVCGDADASGGIDIDDVVFLINHIFSGGPAPAPGCCEPDCPPTVTDHDGNVYQTVLIGDQCWMMENLKVTHYRNGDPIPRVTSGVTWSGLSSGAYCEYENDTNNVETYGRLYNWYAVDDSRGLAPEGWHVPSDDEWKQLERYLGMSLADADAIGYRGTDEGGKLKETDTTHWIPPNEGATNESGFSALPGGYRHCDDGLFETMDYFACLWSSTEGLYGVDAWFRRLSYSTSQVDRGSQFMTWGFSVRCVRD